MPETPRFSISELANEFEITTRTIRFYEEKGLLAPTREGNSRTYSPADRVTLKLILRGKRLGFSLDESRDIIQMYNPSQGNRKQLRCLVEEIRKKRDALKQQFHDIKAMMTDLDHCEQQCLEAIGETPSVRE